LRARRGRDEPVEVSDVPPRLLDNLWQAKLAVLNAISVRLDAEALRVKVG
jgi:hypothetical protein